MSPFDKYNELAIRIATFSVNTPEDLKELLELLDEKDKELRRLAKEFNLEYLIKK